LQFTKFRLIFSAVKFSAFGGRITIITYFYESQARGFTRRITSNSPILGIFYIPKIEQNCSCFKTRTAASLCWSWLVTIRYQSENIQTSWQTTSSYIQLEKLNLKIQYQSTSFYFLFVLYIQVKSNIQRQRRPIFETRKNQPETTIILNRFCMCMQKQTNWSQDNIFTIWAPSESKNPEKN